MNLDELSYKECLWRRHLIIRFTVIAVVTISLVLLGGCKGGKNGEENGGAGENDSAVSCEHVFGDWVTDDEATCTVDGTKHRDCTLCGNYSETETIEAKGHDNTHYDAKEPDCDSIGWEEYDVCSVCGESGYETIYPTHEIENGKCILCNRMVVLTVEDLLYISKSEQNMYKSYVLGRDIDLSGMEWTPISHDSTVFKGVFDGAGFTISNFKITSPKRIQTHGMECVGFFAYNAGTIKNLNLSDFEINIPESRDDTIYVGTIAAFNYSTTKNCHVATERIVVNTRMCHVGGIAGSNGSTATIEGCSVNTYLECYSGRTGGFVIAGGICGVNGGGKIVESCSLSNIIDSYSYGYANVGGIVGKNQNNADVTKCYSVTRVMSSVAGHSGTNYCGGLVGYNDYGNITGSYVTGSVRSFVSAENGCQMFSIAGGLVGYAKRGNITQCYTTGNVSSNCMHLWGGSSSAGGIVGYNEKVKISNCYATGNIYVSGAYDYLNYGGGVVAEGDYIGSNLSNTYRLDTQEFVFDNNGSSSNEPTNNYGFTVSEERLLSVDFQKNELKFFDDYWEFTEGEHPTIKIAIE